MTSDFSGPISDKNVIQVMKSRTGAEELIFSKTMMSGQKNIKFLILRFCNQFQVCKWNKKRLQSISKNPQIFWKMFLYQQTYGLKDGNYKPNGRISQLWWAITNALQIYRKSV